MVGPGEQVRRTAIAVRAAEPRYRYRDTLKGSKAHSERALVTIGHGDRGHTLGLFRKVINVPALRLVGAKVAGNPCLQAPGTASTAGIEISARGKADAT